MKHIDYRDLPHQTNLYLDFIYDFEKVNKYFNGDFRSEKDISRLIEVAKNRNINRPALVEILLQQNKFLNDSRSTENIKKLIDANTVAIVTGQQLGLCAGPLYTIYKIFSILKMADQFNNDYPDYQFVPIFWLESEDHDFFEINKVKVIDKQNSLVTLNYFPEGKPVEKNFGATGRIKLDSFIDSFNESILSALNLTEYHESIKKLLYDNYATDRTIQESFCLFINSIIRNSGLIFINPGDPQIKRILRPVFELELKSSPKTSEIVIGLSAELEEIYHAQVKAKPINMFMHHTKGRYPIEPFGDNYTLKGIRQKYSQSDILEMLNSSPEVFSPNVILRPICQDYLLPTFCYVAGPSEITYLAQFKPVYEHFKIEMPLIYPRASVTIVENKIQKILDKFQINITDLFTNYESVLRKVSEHISGVKIDLRFDNIEKINDLIFDDLQKDTLNIDKTLIDNLENTKDRVQNYYSLFKEKLFNSQKRNNKIALDQVEKTVLHLFPKNNLQEREINILYFLNKYSLNFTNRLREEIKTDLFNHQIIEI